MPALGEDKQGATAGRAGFIGAVGRAVEPCLGEKKSLCAEIGVCEAVDAVEDGVSLLVAGLHASAVEVIEADVSSDSAVRSAHQ